MGESQSLPGFRQPLTYTGEGKGGPCPYEEDVLLRRPLPLLLNTYIPNSTTKIQRIFGYTYYTYYDCTTTAQTTLLLYILEYRYFSSSVWTDICSVIL